MAIQVWDVHLKSDKCLHKRDGNIGVQVITSTLEHWMPVWEKQD